MLTVSDTAYAIAAIRAEENDRPAAERLFLDPYAPIFARAGAHASEGVARFSSLPFLRDAVRLRTRFIDDLVREPTSAQVVLLGAGFDARALRLPEIAERGARVYEVDFAEQLATKRALLEAAGVAMPPFRDEVACDFNDPGFGAVVEASLAARGFRAGAGTLFVWEGVVAYLDDDAMDRTLRFAAHAGGAGTRIVFDAAGSRFEPSSAAARTARAGFATCEQTALDEVWRRYLPGEPHENAVLAQMFVASV